jgi:hypothetical protein
MTFHDRLSDLIGQRVLVNANGFEGRYAVGTLKMVDHDLLMIQLEKELVYYPLSRVLEVSKTNEGLCYVPVNNNHIEVQAADVSNEASVSNLIKLSEAS